MADYASEMRLFDPRLGQRLYLDAGERERFLQHIDCLENLSHRLFCEVLHWTGARVSEALAVTGQHINFERQTMTFRTLKKRKLTRQGELKAPVFRQVPVPQALLSVLNYYFDLGNRQARRDPTLSDPLWPHRTDPERPMSRATGWRIIKRVLDAAGIEGPQATPKGFRHGMAVAMVLGGVDVYTLQNILGHERPETTAIYLQVRGQEAQTLQMQYWAEANKQWAHNTPSDVTPGQPHE